MNDTFTETLAHRRQAVESALDQLVPALDHHPKRLLEAMRYSLLAGGKRLRPILALAACEAVGGNTAHAMPVACALECIHTYSLIHDDLPAMDDDDLRRGRPTCHKAFDEATAILAGDALLTYAFQLAARPIPGVAPAVQLEVLERMATDAGVFGMVGGQQLDLEGEHKEVDLAGLQDIHIHKTGALIRFACVAGARLGGAEEEQVQRLKRYGEAIGLAFQIMDDVLDEIGNPEELGKATGSDARKAKATYTRLLGLPQAKQEAEQLVEQALAALAPFGPGADLLRQLARYIVTRSH